MGEPQDIDSCLDLSAYLKHVLAAFGMDTSIIFDSLDGCRLVPFQAAVKRGVWPHIWLALEPFFKKHRSAYRRHYGGSGAPNIQADVSPRFCQRAAPVDPQDACISVDDDLALEVKNTFVHFATQ